MPIKIVREGDLYAAEVTPPQGAWRSSHPLPNDELGRKLLSLGCDPAEIRHALLEAGVEPFTHEYRELAEKARPHLLAALAGRRKVRTQRPFTEAWLGYALYYYSRPLSLWEVIESADSVNHLIPDPDEIAWAFLRLRARGWLAVQGDTYGLTEEGRLAMGTIVNEGVVERLEKWISANPSPATVTWIRRYVEKKRENPTSHN